MAQPAWDLRVSPWRLHCLAASRTAGEHGGERRRAKQPFGDHSEDAAAAHGICSGEAGLRLPYIGPVLSVAVLRMCRHHSGMHRRCSACSAQLISRRCVLPAVGCTVCHTGGWLHTLNECVGPTHPTSVAVQERTAAGQLRIRHSAALQHHHQRPRPHLRAGRDWGECEPRFRVPARPPGKRQLCSTWPMLSSTILRTPQRRLPCWTAAPTQDRTGAAALLPQSCPWHCSGILWARIHHRVSASHCSRQHRLHTHGMPASERWPEPSSPFAAWKANMK